MYELDIIDLYHDLLKYIVKFPHYCRNENKIFLYLGCAMTLVAKLRFFFRNVQLLSFSDCAAYTLRHTSTVQYLECNEHGITKHSRIEHE